MRKELHMRSKCSDAKLPRSECWMQRQYKRIVVILVDALRYDFLIPLEHSAPKSFYRGHMPGVKKLLARGAQIGLFLADPPTTTLQRIKAITTGTLPTFIDAGDNFAPSAHINEDNIFFQARSSNLNVTFMGDDTWTSLYPNMFTRAHPFDSFDINDLTTVDAAVKELLRDEMISQPSANLIVAHVLGVDHCGHKYGPNHIQMTNQLRKVDEIIFETANELFNDELLIVLGDHGMTSTGDHGGDSDDEINAGLLIFSPGRTFPPLKEGLRQIDLVPTLSLLLGLPIPFSNLGIVIDSLFPQNLSKQAIALNYEQMRRFANTYAAANPSFEIAEIILHDTANSEEQLRTMQRLQASLRAAWTQFDLGLMRLGVLSFVEALLYTLSSRPLSAAQSVIRSGCLLLQLSVIFGGSNDSPAVPLLLAVLPLSILHSLISIVSDLLTLRFLSFPRLFAHACVFIHASSFLSNSFVVCEAEVVRFLAQSILLVSTGARVVNGYIDHHRKVVAHTNLLMHILSICNAWDLGVLLVSLVLLRMEPLFHRCREEEIGCEQYMPLEPISSLSPDALFWRFLLATGVIYSLNYLMSRILPDNLPNSVRIARSLSWPVHAFITFYHLIQLVPHNDSMQKRIQLMGIVLAIGVYVMSAAAAFMCICTKNGPNRAVYLCFVHALCWPLLLLLGDGLQPSLVAFLIILYGSIHLTSEAVLPLLLSILIPFGFYLTGHSPTLSAIPWQAAFVGLPGNFPLPAYSEDI
ncbi:unnamed protein product [Cylicocyclus nassatus]|uniref:GPI ethanolamine phosphate transferase 3 n=1 Tax=Cylicocyclus nassatus TaxID=53992 RepID=A0AA36GQE2_CYLNA|nr:unnamed protein product [Cylicocyclus nassatus]